MTVTDLLRFSTFPEIVADEVIVGANDIDEIFPLVIDALVEETLKAPPVVSPFALIANALAPD